MKLTERINKFRAKINDIYINSNVSESINKDIYALSMLNPLLINKHYLPFTGGALGPYAIALILNEIIINNRKQIIEFGSGISTILIARLIQQHGLDCRFISVEHNIEWFKTLKSILRKEEIDKNVELVLAPLKETKHELGKSFWYELSKYDLNFNSLDLVIIDGPPAYLFENRYSRFPAMDFCHKYLNKSFFIFFDDTNRQGEKEILEIWERKFNIRFNKENRSFAYACDEINLNPLPWKHKGY